MNKTLIFLFIFCVVSSLAQPKVQLVDIQVTPNSSDRNFKQDEKIKFDISVSKNHLPLYDVKIRYELSYDMMPAFETKEIILTNGKARIDAGKFVIPGFLRCIVRLSYDSKEYTGIATAGIEPEKIKPTIPYPDDFLNFWEKAKADNAKIPLSPTMTLLPERCTDKVNVYHVRFQNYRHGNYVYAVLSIPKKEGKYPAILKVPGAGVRSYYGDINRAEQDIIVLETGIHGIPVNMEEVVYESLRNGALRDYSQANWDDRDKVYYKRVYLGCVKAVDYIFSLDKFDGENVIVEGGSQGGALAIVTAGLDSRIKGLISYYPALSDLTGYLHGRAGGWPHLFRNNKDEACVLEQKVKTASYYDVVNFARHIKVPGFYSFGYNDMTCAPTSVYSSINSITAQKDVLIIPETGHWTYPEQWRQGDNWGKNLLKTK